MHHEYLDEYVGDVCHEINLENQIFDKDENGQQVGVAKKQVSSELMPKPDCNLPIVAFKVTVMSNYVDFILGSS